MIPIATWTVKLLKYGVIVCVLGGAAAYGTGMITQEDLSSTQESAVGAINGSDTNKTGVHQEGVNLTKTETLFIEFLNEERKNRSLGIVEKGGVLTEMGRKHSRDMALKEYFDHVEPDGDTINDRFRKNGLIPECNLPIKGTDRYYSGTENIAKSHIHSEVSYDWAKGGTYYVSDEEDLAWALFQMWMHSKGHREAMLVYSADEAGLGLYITDDNVVYASLELC